MFRLGPPVYPVSVAILTRPWLLAAQCVLGIGFHISGILFLPPLAIFIFARGIA